MDAATQRHVRRLAIKSHLLRVGIEGRVAADDRCGYRHIIARHDFLPADIDFLRGDPERRYRSKGTQRSEEHTSELQSLMRTSYAVFCLKKKTSTTLTNATDNVTTPRTQQKIYTTN